MKPAGMAYGRLAFGIAIAIAIYGVDACKSCYLKYRGVIKYGYTFYIFLATGVYMEDFVQYGQKCYRFLGDTNVKNDKAREMCESANAQLPDFGTEDTWNGFRQAIETSKTLQNIRDTIFPSLNFPIF